MHLIRTARFAALAVVIASTAGLLPATGPAEAAPAYPESEHVYFGCHISTVAYLARFSAEHPAERGRPAVLMMDNADGVRRPHTIALAYRSIYRSMVDRPLLLGLCSSFGHLLSVYIN